jgi:hypothetical protein
MQPFPVDFDWSVESVTKRSGQLMYCSTLSYADMAVFEIFWKFDLKWRFVGDSYFIIWKWKVLVLSIWQDWQPYFNSGNNIAIETLFNNCGNIQQIWTVKQESFWKGVNVLFHSSVLKVTPCSVIFDSFLNIKAYYLHSQLAV